MQPTDIQVALHRFRERCKASGLSLTIQRQMIFESILECGGHPTPEEIHGRVSRRQPSISLATVYKNLKVFVDAGVFSEATKRHAAARIETNPEPHQHLVCSECDAMFDINPGNFDAPRVRGKLPRGFEIQRVYVEIVGICGSCARKQTSKQQS